MLRTPVDYRPFECWTLGSECDGGFAQFTVAPARETYAVRSDRSDEELAAVPCAYSTAENMMHRAGGRVGAGARDRGIRRSRTRGGAAREASGRHGHRGVLGRQGGRGAGPGSRSHRGPRRGPGRRPRQSIRGRGDRSRRRGSVPATAGPVARGGRYAIAGAIGGPIAEIDLRTLYLKDLSLLGCTFQEDEVFENLIGYVERGEVRPVVSRTYPLDEIARAQEDFLQKRHIGKLVLVPPTAGQSSREDRTDRALQGRVALLGRCLPAVGRPHVRVVRRLDRPDHLRQRHRGLGREHTVRIDLHRRSRPGRPSRGSPSSHRHCSAATPGRPTGSPS